MNMNTAEKAKIFVVGIAAIMAVGFFGWTINKYVLRSQAAVSNVTVEMNPSSGAVPENSIQVIIKPQEAGKKISAVDAVFDVKNGTFIGSDGCSKLEGGDKSIFTELFDEVNGAKGRYSCGVLKKDAELPEGVVIGITVACTNNDPITVSFNTQASQIVGNVEGVQYGFGNVTSATFDCSGKGGGGTPPVPPQGDGQVSASFSPDTCAVDKGKACQYQLNIVSRKTENKISGYFVKLAFDKGILKATEVKGPVGASEQPKVTPPAISPPKTDGPVLGVQLAQSPGTVLATPSPASSAISPTVGAPATRDCRSDQECVTKFCSGNPFCPMRCIIQPGQTTGLCTPPNQPSPSVGTPVPSGGPQPLSSCKVVKTLIDNDKGEVGLLLVCDSPAQGLFQSFTNTFSFSAIGDGEGQLKIASIQVVGPQGAPLYTVDKGIAKYVIGGGRGGGATNVTLQVKGRLQCIPQKPKNAPSSFGAQIGLKDGGLKEPIFKDVELTFDDKGHLSGEVAFSANTNETEGYAVYSKFKKHLRKKICDATARESFPGSYRCDRGKIDLKPGKNVIDMSNVVQLFGDLAYGDQDGVVNSFDMAKIRLCLGSTEESCVRNADSNFDRIVNASDWACAIAALNERYDSE